MYMYTYMYDIVYFICFVTCTCMYMCLTIKYVYVHVILEGVGYYCSNIIILRMKT